MRRTATLVLAMIIAAVAAPSVARNQERSVTKTYTITRGHIQFNSNEVAWMGAQAVSFRARSGERSITVTLKDDTGNPVRGRVEIGSSAVQFCSETAKPIKVTPGQKIKIHAVFGQCGNGVSFATEGKIRVTFSR